MAEADVALDTLLLTRSFAHHHRVNETSAQLAALLTETRNPASANIDTLSTEEMLRVFNDEDAKITAAVRAEIPNIAEAIDAIAERFALGGRLFYTGAGTSGRLGVLDAS